jgi:hypothetical protein
MPRMSERHLDQNTGRQHQNRDPRMEPIRQRRMAQTLGGNKMRKTTRITLAITVICMALAGCGSASKTSAPAHAIAATGTTCSEESSDERIKECIVTLSETRRVDCVITTGSHGVSGISCDWDHVSGADKEPAR